MPDRPRFPRTAVICVAAFLFFAALAAACAKAPYTGRSQLLLVSEQQEMALGLSTSQQILKKEPASRNRTYISAVREVGTDISRVAERPDYQWEFNVIAKDVANAFCLPGGKIFVYEGLFKYARNRSQLAAVIGHEVAHALARHGGERMSQAVVANAGGAVLSAALGVTGSEAQAFSIAYGVGVNYGIILPFGRDQEYEADRIGLILMAKAGYHPGAALSFWENMSRREGRPNPPEFLSSHPANENRIRAIRELLPEAMRYYRP